MALEIIGAGFGRTGTYSLKVALERLGFGPCHHMSEVIGDPEQIRLWTEAAEGRPDYVSIFAGFSSAVDFPVSAYWQDVLAATPGAKVILSDRDPEDWYGSFSQTILPLILDKTSWPEDRRAWFDAGDAAPMADAWVRSDGVSAQHPIGGRDEGYDTVVASFAKIAAIAGGGEIRLLDQKIDAGSDMAVETGVETGTLVIAGHKATIHHRVTNVYRRMNGEWKLAHHHANLSEAMLDILKRLSEAA